MQKAERDGVRDTVLTGLIGFLFVSAVYSLIASGKEIQKENVDRASAFPPSGRIFELKLPPPLDKIQLPHLDNSN